MRTEIDTPRMPAGRALFDPKHLQALASISEGHQRAIEHGERPALTGDERALRAFWKGIDLVEHARTDDTGFDPSQLLSAAVHFFSVAAVIEPDFADAYLGLAACYQRLGRDDELELALLALAHTAELIGETERLIQLRLDATYSPSIASVSTIIKPVDARLALAACAINRRNPLLAWRWLPILGLDESHRAEWRILTARLCMLVPGWLPQALARFQYADSSYHVALNCDRLLGLAEAEMLLGLDRLVPAYHQRLAHANAEDLAKWNEEAAARVVNRALYLSGQLYERELRFDDALAEYARIAPDSGDYLAARERIEELAGRERTPEETKALFDRLVAPIEYELTLNDEIDERMQLFEDDDPFWPADDD